MARRTINTDRYGITPNPRSKGAYVELKLVRCGSAWNLNGEPMTSAGEVIANIGVIIEELERQLAKQLADKRETADHHNARELHARLYRLREVELRTWGDIASELEIPEPRLAKIRLAAIELGLATKEGDNVRWLPPETA
jgi:hypothetical protein